MYSDPVFISENLLWENNMIYSAITSFFSCHRGGILGTATNSPINTPFLQRMPYQPIIEKWIAWGKKGYHRIVQIEGTPRNIALGFALGLFIGMTPTMGFQMAIAVFFAAIFGWNKISSAAGVWITNPVTAPFVYGMNYMAGKKIFHIQVTTPPMADFSMKSVIDLLCETPDILLALTLGGIVIGIPLSLGGYYLTYSVVQKYQIIRKKYKHPDDQSPDHLM